MNDRYLYRAKRIFDGKWEEGFLTKINRQMHIVNQCGENTAHQIDESTICQCTGVKDKNGKLIFENDIVIINGWIGKVMWSSHDISYIVLPNDEIKNETYCLGYWIIECDVEVIGNETDNPELLEVTRENV